MGLRAVRKRKNGKAALALAVFLLSTVAVLALLHTIIQMNVVATVPAFDSILSLHNGIDLDHDGMNEFVFRRVDGPGVLEFYESTGDDAFSLAHVLDLSMGPLYTSYIPQDAGDPDQDGLSELLVRGRTGNIWYVRLYESVSADTYPTELVWEITSTARCRIADTDNDGLQEIVSAGTLVDEFGNFVERAFVIYENDGDNSYAEIHHETLVEFVQSVEVLDDIDGDGRDEILHATVGKVYAYEAIGDNAYEQVWTRDLIHSGAGQLVNAVALVDGGDLDGDGKKEFLVGGLETVAAGFPTLSVVFLFEAVGNDDVEVVATFTGEIDGESLTSVNVVDVDGDGWREIVIGRGSDIRIYRNKGDNAWEEIWATDTVNVAYFYNLMIGAGDHDKDGKEEILFRGTDSFTVVYEIDPADAVDTDLDGHVDAIDNCPTVSNPGQADGDADTVGDACDNCVDFPNPAQGPVALGQTIQALDPENFVWSTPVDIVYMRGDLSLVSSYTWNLVQSVPLTASFMDLSTPSPSAAFFYLVRPDCPAGSWQTSPGAEPGRDAALP